MIDNHSINIKSYRKPNPFNRLAYKYIRKSKAKRSFEYAEKLRSLNINTPQPIAYLEQVDAWGMEFSFFVSEHLDNAITFADVLVMQPSTQRTETIKQFIDFIYDLHEKGIQFLNNNAGICSSLRNQITGTIFI